MASNKTLTKLEEILAEKGIDADTISQVVSDERIKRVASGRTIKDPIKVAVGKIFHLLHSNEMLGNSRDETMTEQIEETIKIARNWPAWEGDYQALDKTTGEAITKHQVKKAGVDFDRPELGEQFSQADSDRLVDALLSMAGYEPPEPNSPKPAKKESKKESKKAGNKSKGN